MLDLVRLSSRPLFPPGGRDLYRQIAVLADVKPGDELLVVACGTGVTLEYFVREYAVQGYGVEPDPDLAKATEQWGREADPRSRFQVQQAPVDDLPYRDGMFDVVVGEIGLTTSAAPEDAIAELVRVAKPGARIALVQLVWKAPVEPERQEALSRHLGAKPHMLVEIKRALRAVGIERLHVEAWTDEETAFRPALKKPFPDFAELFSLPEKLGILRRVWGRWGWHGVRTAIGREVTIHRLLTRERILGLDMIVGRKSGEAPEVGDTADGGEASEEGEESAGEDETTAELPLFAPPNRS